MWSSIAFVIVYILSFPFHSIQFADENPELMSKLNNLSYLVFLPGKS